MYYIGIKEHIFPVHSPICQTVLDSVSLMLNFVVYIVPSDRSQEIIILNNMILKYHLEAFNCNT